MFSISAAKLSSLRNRLSCASAIQNSRILFNISRCIGSNVSLIARSQSAAFSNGSAKAMDRSYRTGLAASRHHIALSPYHTDDRVVLT